MRLYASQGQLAFTLEGTGVPQNRTNEAYAVWFTSPNGGSQRLGFAQPVGSNGQLGTTGPRTEDLDKFPRWLARYKQVVVRASATATPSSRGRSCSAALPSSYAYTPSSHALSAASRAAASTPSTNRCALIPTTLP